MSEKPVWCYICHSTDPSRNIVTCDKEHQAHCSACCGKKDERNNDLVRRRDEALQKLKAIRGW